IPRTALAASLSDQRIIGSSSARSEAVSSLERTDGRFRYATSIIALTTLAEWNVCLECQPHERDRVRTAKPITPCRWDAYRIAAPTEGCQGRGGLPAPKVTAAATSARSPASALA